VDQEPRSPLPYLNPDPPAAVNINVGAIVSLTSGVAGLLFTLSLCAGVWQSTIPFISRHAVWINALLATVAVISGGIGAVQAPKDSGYFTLSMIGYIAGMILFCATAALFLAF
jgi:hypothetical protein